MDVSGDDIAEVVLQQFNTLPTKAKPLVRCSGVREWVPLSGIVVQGKSSLTCLAVATGMKCLPQSKISFAKGIVLHDWHAEVLAIRSFNRFLLEECRALLLEQKKSSEYIRLRGDEEKTEANFQPFTMKEGIQLHMYCSEAPCGDASMELTMAAQEDSTPWVIPPTSNSAAEEAPATPSPPLSSISLADSSSKAPPSPSILHGRSYFSALGLVRRKPSRPDAPPTLSKSCSDKIALKQCTSLLSSITSLLICPSNLYLSSLVLPESQFSSTASERAFSSDGRMKGVEGRQWEGGYRFEEFEIKTTTQEFKYSRRQSLQAGEKLVPSNISSSWITQPTSRPSLQGQGQLETLIGGVMQGRKQYDIRGASKVCKRRMWRLALEVAAMVSVPVVERCLSLATYERVKGSDCLEWRRSVKREVREKALKPWVRNAGGEVFGYDSIES